MFIDTHAHLYRETYGEELEKVIESLPLNNISKVVNVAVTPKSGFEIIALAEKYPYLYATAGFHPTELNNYQDGDFEIIREQLQHPKVIAIGEIGLDNHWQEVDPQIQKKYFIKLLELSLSENLPVIIHSREADEEVLKIISEVNSKYRGVFHCYAGSLDMAEKLIEKGFLISFTGNITYKKTDRTEIIEKIPLEKIMIETDSPYMTPVPWRGKRNDPAKIIKVAERIAEIKGISLDKVAVITSTNAVNLFNFI